MEHNHDHHHHNFDESSITRLWISIFLNLMITIAEVVGGLLSNSLSLLSDAVHNLSDTASLGISLVARKISKKDPNSEKTFGYRRAEIIGAFINLITLVIIALFLVKEGVERFFEPAEIDGLTMFWVAIVGLLGNFATAVLLFRDSKDSLNIRSSFIHILSDGLSSVAVIIGGWLIITYQWYIVDTIITVLIAAYIMWQAFHMLRESVNILMEAKPDNIDLNKLTTAIKSVPNVCDAHHVHVWQLDEHQVMLESHILIKKRDLSELEIIKKEIKQILHDKFEILHSTLEFEFEPCDAVHHGDEPEHHH